MTKSLILLLCIAAQWTFTSCAGPEPHRTAREDISVKNTKADECAGVCNLKTKLIQNKYKVERFSDAEATAPAIEKFKKSIGNNCLTAVISGNISECTDSFPPEETEEQDSWFVFTNKRATEIFVALKLSDIENGKPEHPGFQIDSFCAKDEKSAKEMMKWVIDSSPNNVLIEVSGMSRDFFRSLRPAHTESSAVTTFVYQKSKTRAISFSQSDAKNP